MTRIAAALACVALLLAGCEEKPSAFRKVDGVWRYHDLPLTDVDAATFAALDGHYAKDAKRVYYADTWRDGKEYWTVKRARIRAIDGADPATFRLLASGYAKDARGVWYEGERFAVRDVASFELLDYGFARDRSTGYYHQAIVDGSEGATFVVVDSHHAKDRSRGFYLDLEPAHPRPIRRVKALRDVDVATLTSLGGGYVKDAKRVFYQGEPVAGADPVSFATLSPPVDGADAKDARGSYREGRRIP